MATWTVKLTDPPEISCNFTPHCAFHGGDTRLLPMQLQPIMFPVYGGADISLGHAVDFHVKCPDCGYREIFGVAVSEAEFDELMKCAKKNAEKTDD